MNHQFQMASSKIRSQIQAREDLTDVLQIDTTQLAESIATQVFDELIAQHLYHLKFYCAHGIVHCFHNEYMLATKDFTDTIKEARTHQLHLTHTLYSFLGPAEDCIHCILWDEAGPAAAEFMILIAGRTIQSKVVVAADVLGWVDWST
ncbi:hypothetical protein NEOLEDRAFT_1149498 [Neolentinus lepideus HHB14362 ss-1]|uniref:Uncharacterized protein n=1 Tax=Neolentinus lepideus HHB14362 ss-1 TaxID=1314782 RepID=A0A165R2E5_9AGAM|nr:hypothetical protein NEOLEDRAFT_1149498 [Neolentinus lepideus HHB14362 ss-1]